MKFVYCWLFVSLAPVLWVEAAALRSAPMAGVWAATGTPFRATLELQDAQDRSQPVKPRGGRAHAVHAVLLTIHHADRPSPASLIAPQQVFSVVDVGLDACEITYYEAVARGPSGTQLRLMLTDRRSAVRLDCLTNITKGRPPWSVAVYEVDESAAIQDVSVQRPIAYLDGAPDGDDDMEAWRDQRFHDAWVGTIGQKRNPLTAQAHYAFTSVDHADAYVLDFDNARVALQSCGPHFMEAVLARAGVAPLVDQGGGAISPIGASSNVGVGSGSGPDCALFPLCKRPCLSYRFGGKQAGHARSEHPTHRRACLRATRTPEGGRVTGG